MTLAAVATLSASCGFLEVEQVGKSDIDTYFSEVSALQPALNGCYHLLYSFYDREMLAYPEVTGDLVDLSSNNATWTNQYNFISTYLEETTAVGYIWKLGYSVIQNVNYIITYAPDLRKKNPDSASVIDNILAQAYFLRALTHLDICLTYAQNYTYTSDASHLGVPVMTSIPVVTDKMRRSTVREVYSQIIADLEKALSTFTADYSFNEYFASPAACKAGETAYVLAIRRGKSDGVNYGHDVLAYNGGNWSSLRSNYVREGATQTGTYVYDITAAEDGSVYILTADNASDGSAYHFVVEKYNPTTKDWSVVGGSFYPYVHADSHDRAKIAVAPDGTIYLLYLDNKSNALNLTWFDSETKQWADPLLVANEKATDPCIAFTTSGVGYIAFTDANNAEKVFIYR